MMTTTTTHHAGGKMQSHLKPRGIHCCKTAVLQWEYYANTTQNMSFLLMTNILNNKLVNGFDNFPARTIQQSHKLINIRDGRGIETVIAPSCPCFIIQHENRLLITSCDHFISQRTRHKSTRWLENNTIINSTFHSQALPQTQKG